MAVNRNRSDFVSSRSAAAVLVLLGVCVAHGAGIECNSTAWGGCDSETLFLLTSTAEAKSPQQAVPFTWDATTGRFILRTQLTSSESFVFTSDRDGTSMRYHALKGSWQKFGPRGHGGRWKLRMAELQSHNTKFGAVFADAIYKVVVDLKAGDMTYLCTQRCGEIDAKFPKSGTSRKVTLLYTAMIGGRLLPHHPSTGLPCNQTDVALWGCQGGLPYIAAYARKLRNQGRDVALLDLGGFFTGGEFYGQDRGLTAATLAQLSGYDALSLSEHDMQGGVETMRLFANALGTIPLLLSNGLLPAELTGNRSTDMVPLVSEWTVLQTASGLKLGLLSLASTSLTEYGIPTNALGGSWTKTVVPTLWELSTRRGVDIIVVMTSSREASLRYELHTYAPAVDLVIGGSTQTDGPLYVDISKVPRANFDSGLTGQGTYLQQVEITLNEKGELIDVDSMQIPMDSSTLALDVNDTVLKAGAEAFAALQPQADVELAQLDDPLPFETDSDLFLEGPSWPGPETFPLPRFMAHALLDVCSDCHVVMMHPKFVAGRLQKGNITAADVARILPLNAELLAFSLPGAHLIELVKFLWFEDRSWLLFAGMRVYINTMEGTMSEGAVAKIEVFNGWRFVDVDRGEAYKVLLPRSSVIANLFPGLLKTISAKASTEGTLVQYFKAYLKYRRDRSISLTNPWRTAPADITSIREYQRAYQENCAEEAKSIADIQNRTEHDCWLIMNGHASAAEDARRLVSCSAGSQVIGSTLQCTPCAHGRAEARRFETPELYQYVWFWRGEQGMVGDFVLQGGELRPHIVMVEVLKEQVCRECAKGRYTDRNAQTACKDCDPGRFTNGTGTERCEFCQTGEYRRESGSSYCDQCPPGRFAFGIRHTECAECPVGKWAADFGESECHSCVGKSTTTVKNVSVGGTYQWVIHAGASSESLCACINGFYSTANGSNFTNDSCVRCGEGLDCLGKPLPRVLAGYYADEDLSDLSVFKCYEEAFLRCLGGLPGRTCAANRTGIACGECKDDMYPVSDGTCSPCNGEPHLVPSALGIIVFLLGVGLAYGWQELGDRGTRGSIELSVALYVGLLMTVTQQYNVLGMIAVAWPAPASSALHFAKLAGFDVEVLTPHCLFQPTVLARFLVKICLAPAAVVVILVIHVVAVKLGHLTTFSSRSAVLVAAVGTIYNGLFLSIITASIEPLQCLENPNGLLTSAAYSTLVCGSDEHHYLIIIGMVVLLVPIAFLALSIQATWQFPMKRPSGTASFFRAYDFLFVRYTVQTYFFGTCHLVRSFALSLMLLIPGRFVQIVVAQAILLLQLAGVMYYQPWRIRYVNFVDAGLTFLLLVFLSTAALFVENVPADVSGTMGFWILVGSAALLLLALLVKVCYEVNAKFNKPYSFYICHHKAMAGQFARLVKSLATVNKHSSGHVHVSSPDLTDLDEVIDCVENRAQNIVVLCTPALLLRPWCLAELVAAKASKVRIVRVLFPDFVEPDESFILKLQANVPGVMDLAGNGIGIDMVHDMLRWLPSCPSIALPLSLGPKSLDAFTKALLSPNWEKWMGMTKIAPSPIEDIVDSSLKTIIVVDCMNMEAVANGHLLRGCLRTHFTTSEQIPRVRMKGQELPRDLKSVLFICTRGVFDSVDIQRLLIQMGSRTSPLHVLPILGDDEFEVPSEFSLQQQFCDQREPSPQLFVHVIRQIFAQHMWLRSFRDNDSFADRKCSEFRTALLNTESEIQDKAMEILHRLRNEQAQIKLAQKEQEADAPEHGSPASKVHIDYQAITADPNLSPGATNQGVLASSDNYEDFAAGAFLCKARGGAAGNNIVVRVKPLSPSGAGGPLSPSRPAPKGPVPQLQLGN